MRLWSAAMAKQLAIAATDHCASAAQQPHDGVTRRGSLPFIAGEPPCPEEDLGDFLLRGAGARTIHGLQHAARPRQLLARQPGVGRNAAAMERGQEAGDGLDPIESLRSERHQGDDGLTGGRVAGKNEVETLAVAEVVQDVQAVLGHADLRRFRGRDKGLRGAKDGGR